MQSQVSELHFLCIFRNPLQQNSRRKKKIGISSQLLWSFVGTQESPHFLPSHQGGAELSTVATTCAGYIFFFKIKVLFQRGAQSPTVKNKPGPLWDSRTFPEGTKGSGS